MPDEAFSDAWVDTIRNATERVAALIPSAAAADPRPAAPPPAWDRAGTIDLLRRERFAEALACVRRQQPSERDANPDKLLLEATLLAHASRIEAAEDVCRRLLSIDELNAGAHYVLALCREQAGDRDAAAEHDRVAIYLDSAFAMPRLHWDCSRAAPATTAPPVANWDGLWSCSSAKTHPGCCCSAAGSTATP